MRASPFFKALSIAIIALASGLPAQAQTVQNADILGVRLGDSLETAQKKLKDSGNDYKFDVTKGSVSSGPFRSDEMTFGAAAVSKDGKDKVLIITSVVAPYPILAISRDQRFKDKEEPLLADIEAGLIAKAGQPQFKDTVGVYQLLLDWGFDRRKKEGYYCNSQSQEIVSTPQNGSLMANRVRDECGTTFSAIVANSMANQNLAVALGITLVDHVAVGQNALRVQDIIKKGAAEAQQQEMKAAPKPKL
ncbi:hypothetical protein [Pseudochelatococcus contaminans]|uniref:Uncharacterized protein n=1 Tax=Pseudochelatococcus contaminans TaxID=1538103 RepID=A0A7W5Z5F2_9HYPH|nr:hypothetical protein [Pseudochelatococcus contaminans]MBB3810518.1 hypothetical protein [Pseudochelatococcus contaminans]